VIDGDGLVVGFETTLVLGVIGVKVEPVEADLWPDEQAPASRARARTGRTLPVPRDRCMER
jgi:hypothetical protein